MFSAIREGRYRETEGREAGMDQLGLASDPSQPLLTLQPRPQKSRMWECFHASRRGLLTQLMEYIYISHICQRNGQALTAGDKEECLEVEAQGRDRIRAQGKGHLETGAAGALNGHFTDPLSRSDSPGRAMLLTFARAHLSIGPLSEPQSQPRPFLKQKESPHSATALQGDDSSLAGGTLLP